MWFSDFKIYQLSQTYKSIAGFGLPQNLIPQSGKCEKLDELLPELKKEGHRVLIFSQFTMVLDILEAFLTMRNHRYLRYVTKYFSKLIFKMFFLEQLIHFT